MRPYLSRAHEGRATGGEGLLKAGGDGNGDGDDDGGGLQLERS